VEELFTELKIKMDYESFCKLPRVPGYKSEYCDGEAVLVPRVKAVRLKYDLARTVQFKPFTHPNKVIEISPLESGDWSLLTAPMLSAFATTQPFKTMEVGEATAGVEKCLARTRNGQDGELMLDASIVARLEGNVVGAVIVTIVEETPHLTWLFLEPRAQRRGWGTCLLQSVRSKLASDWSFLHSTARSDNVGALLWHWKLGFEILEVSGRI